VSMRRDIHSRMLDERMEPALRRALFQRSMVYYRDKIQKSMVEVYTPDQLRKAVQEDVAKHFGSDQETLDENAKKANRETYMARNPGMRKADGPYIGPRGGKYADPQHKIPWKEGEQGVGRTKSGKDIPRVPKPDKYYEDWTSVDHANASNFFEGKESVEGHGSDMRGFHSAMMGAKLNEETGRPGFSAREDANKFRKRARKKVREYKRERVKKSFIIPTDEVLKKAEPKGGTYHRRVTSKAGKHRYFYDPEKYESSKDAHVEGKAAAKTQIKKAVQKYMETHGEKGCPIGEVKSLVKRYGSDVVGETMNEMRAEGGLTFKGGKLYLKKSERFVIQPVGFELLQKADAKTPAETIKRQRIEDNTIPTMWQLQDRLKKDGRLHPGQSLAFFCPVYFSGQTMVQKLLKKKDELGEMLVFGLPPITNPGRIKVGLEYMRSLGIQNPERYLIASREDKATKALATYSILPGVEGVQAKNLPEFIAVEAVQLGSFAIVPDEWLNAGDPYNQTYRIPGEDGYSPWWRVPSFKEFQKIRPNLAKQFKMTRKGVVRANMASYGVM